MKSQVIGVVEYSGTPEEKHYKALKFWCPGCQEMKGGGSGLHILPINASNKDPHWTFDGNTEKPTLSPSILTHGRCSLDPVCDTFKQSGHCEHETRCHSYLKEGVFEFLTDCTHTLAGQHVPAPDLPDWAVKME